MMRRRRGSLSHGTGWFGCVIDALQSLAYVLNNFTQSGMATKIEKPSRKLRKERKNRAKKVCVGCFELNPVS